MPDIKEKLVDILRLKPYNMSEVSAGRLADHLIANGVTIQKWISVEEGLPEGECIALSMMPGQRAYREMLIGYIGDSQYSSTGYAAGSDGEHLDDVTHWMPLPESPKGE